MDNTSSMHRPVVTRGRHSASAATMASPTTTQLTRAASTGVGIVLALLGLRNTIEFVTFQFICLSIRNSLTYILV